MLGKVRKFVISAHRLIHPPSQCGCCVQQLVSEQAFCSELNSLKEISGHTMVNHIYDDIEKALAEDDETLIKASENAERELQDIVKRARRSISLPIPSLSIKEKDLVKVKDEVVDSLQKYQQRTMELKDLLSRLKDENIRLLGQLDEKIEEMNKLKNEVSQQEEVADDDHLERQLEEAEKKEEVLRDQPVEKDEAYQVTETKEVKRKPYVAPRRKPTSRHVQKTKYDCVFHGYCFSCNKYGHFARGCREV